MKAFALKFSLLLLVVVSVTLAGCAELPISQVYREKALPALSLKTVIHSPDQYAGSTVIWGGKILKNTNNPEGSELELLELPLDSYERPQITLDSEGRFIAKSSDFLDPEIFQPGKYITIAGEITGQEKRALGNADYPYPVLNLKQIYLWNASMWPFWMHVDYWPGYYDYCPGCLGDYEYYQDMYGHPAPFFFARPFGPHLRLHPRRHYRHEHHEGDHR